MVSSGECVIDEVGSGKLQQVQSSDGGNLALQQIPDGKTHELQSDKKGTTPSVKPEKAPETGKEGCISPVVSEKTLITSDTAASALPDPEGVTPVTREKVSEDGYIPTIREKVTEDGYNWRKYGQKLVKGNEFIRSYYKCTHPNCQVKKQLERTHEGHIVDTIYLGQHDHQKPLNLPLAVGLVVSIVEERPEQTSLKGAEEKSSIAHGQTPHQVDPIDASQPSLVLANGNAKGALSQSNTVQNELDRDDDPVSKRRKKENCRVDATTMEKPTSESRVVIKTLSEVDIVNDGYRWRKYGQKLVKGNPNPRSYYRCSSPGCPVKKHVERASHDAKLVITTYEGRHDHDMPPSRTVTHNVAGLNVNTTAHSNKPATKSEVDTVGLDMGVRSGSGPESRSDEQQDEETRTKSESEHQNSKSELTKETDSVGLDMRSSPQSSPSKQHSSESETKLGENMARVTSQERNFDEQNRMPNAEPVRS